LRISHDVFPYTRAATMMAAIFPPWSLEGGVPRLIERLQDPAERRRIHAELESHVPEWPPWQPGGWPHNLVGAVGWDGILVATVGPDGPVDWIGRSLAEIAAERGEDPFDVVAELMISEQGRVGQLVDEISGRRDRFDALLSIIDHPSAAIVSDAEDYGSGFAHPAHAGAFVRVLRLAREQSWPLADVVRRMTGYPAALIGLDDRGLVREGAAADLVLFDANAVTDRADWNESRRTAGGVPWVVLNGAIVVEQGRYLGGAHGRVLRARSTTP
jgi:N-acyl-D-aspartate/D-glutamate deacylase